MAGPNVQTTRLAASAALCDRLFVAVTAAAAADAAVVVVDRGVSGLIVVDPGCGLRVRALKTAYQSRLLVGMDIAAYLAYTGTPQQPMNLPTILGEPGPSLDSWMRDLLSFGADFAFTPTGQITDLVTLDAAVAEANTVIRSDVVLAVPIPATVIATMDRVALSAGLARSRHPVALIVTGQFDPYAKAVVAQCVRALLIENAHVFLHRTDFAAFEPLAHGALGGSIGYTAGLRHTVTGGFPARTRRKPADRTPIVLLPEIDSFRHQSVFEPWFRNTRPPICDLPGCCGRNLAMLRDTISDRELANLHNLRAWLPIGTQLATQPLADRRSWLHTYRQQVENAYVELRRRTQVRDIHLDKGQKVWLSLGL